MKERWRSLVGPGEGEPAASPDAGEALGVWVLGMLWALVCLWLGYLGGHWILPGVLLAGLLALWGWRHPEWLWWFPTILVLAGMLQPLSPLPMRTRFGPLVYTDLLAIAVVVVSVVRAIGLKQPLLPKTPVDLLVVGVLVLFGVSLLEPQPTGLTLLMLKKTAVRLVVFYATTTIASRPRGSRWVWLAFPLACALFGCHALWARSQGIGMLADQSRIADAAWNSRHGIVNVLLVALPVTVGLSLNAGQLPARLAWIVASLAGTAALTLHASETAAFQPVFLTWTPGSIGRTALACVTLATVAGLALEIRRGRPHESMRWLAVVVTFAGFAVLQPIWPALTGPAVTLLAVGAGLVVGTLRADRRALRSGRTIAPVRRAA